uniref:Store-operated calcium entry-associated regulatory factor n=1 Tax=Sphenodon punctatus TaxID=8508 RepID=A0A8D0HG86_SPHPU
MAAAVARVCCCSRGPLQLLLPLLLLLCSAGASQGWNQEEKVLLREVQVLTLYKNQYTTYRRTFSAPQLQCIGGTADCASYVPAVVQCYNKGWDGYDVQWECKADLDNSYRFGKLEVNCEGYDYPNDPFILRGSCGLQYTLELTEEGQRKARSFGSYRSVDSQDTVGAGVGVIGIIIFGILVYGVYKLFLCDQRPRQSFSHGDDGHSGTYQQDYRRPPPPGFKSAFTGAGGIPGYDANSGPGFWSGLGTGGLLGYLAGSNRARSGSAYFNTWTGPTAAPPTYGNFSGSKPAESSGTRTTSGFGGTKRR